MPPHIDSIQTPHIAVTTNTLATTSLNESGPPRRRSEVLLVDGHSSEYGDFTAAENTSCSRAAEERKAEQIV